MIQSPLDGLLITAPPPPPRLAAPHLSSDFEAAVGTAIGPMPFDALAAKGMAPAIAAPVTNGTPASQAMSEAHVMGDEDGPDSVEPVDALNDAGPDVPQVIWPVPGSVAQVPVAQHEVQHAHPRPTRAVVAPQHAAQAAAAPAPPIRDAPTPSAAGLVRSVHPFTDGNVLPPVGLDGRAEGSALAPDDMPVQTIRPVQVAAPILAAVQVPRAGMPVVAADVPVQMPNNAPDMPPLAADAPLLPQPAAPLPDGVFAAVTGPHAATVPLRNHMLANDGAARPLSGAPGRDTVAFSKPQPSHTDWIMHARSTLIPSDSAPAAAATRPMPDNPVIAAPAGGTSQIIDPALLVQPDSAAGDNAPLPVQPASPRPDISLVAAPSRPAPLPVHRQLGEAIITMQGDSAEITLSPEELGGVRIAVLRDQGGLTITLTTERPETAELMRRHAELLQRELAAAGEEGARLDFASGGQGRFHAPQARRGEGGHAAPPADAAALPRAPHPAASGRLDMRL